MLGWGLIQGGLLKICASRVVANSKGAWANSRFYGNHNLFLHQGSKNSMAMSALHFLNDCASLLSRKMLVFFKSINR